MEEDQEEEEELNGLEEKEKEVSKTSPICLKDDSKTTQRHLKDVSKTLGGDHYISGGGGC